jgi:Ca2+-binding RTX toxin-like protein
MAQSFDTNQVVMSQAALGTVDPAQQNRANITGPDGVVVESFNEYNIQTWHLSPVGDDRLNLADATQDLSVEARGGNDVVIGGSGNDRLLGNVGSDMLIGNGGNDELAGSLGGDVLYGGAGNDVLKIDCADLALNGGKGMIDGGNGYDTLLVEDKTIGIGDQGVTLEGYHPYRAEKVRSTMGNDTVDFHNSRADLTLWGWFGDDYLRTGHGADALVGAAGNDVLIGSWGNDVMYGGDADDFLNADRGSNLMDGGKGNDTYSFISSSNFSTQNIVQEESGELDALRLQTGRRVAFFREGDDLLVGYKGQDAVTRLVDQFAPGADGVELIANQKGLDIVKTMASTQGASAALGQATGAKVGIGAMAFTAAEIDTITGHIAGMAAVTSLADVQNNEALLKYISTFA